MMTPLELDDFIDEVLTNKPTSLEEWEAAFCTLAYEAQDIRTIEASLELAINNKYDEQAVRELAVATLEIYQHWTGQAEDVQKEVDPEVKAQIETIVEPMKETFHKLLQEMKDEGSLDY